MHTFSSPYNSQSNGKAESAVKIAKRLLKLSKDPWLALLEWWNTPTVDIGSCPCQWLFSRRTRGGVITSVEKLQPQVQEDMWQRKLKKQQQIQARRGVDRNPLPLLTIGQPVLVQDWLSKKTVDSRALCGSTLKPVIPGGSGWTVAAAKSRILKAHHAGPASNGTTGY